MHLPKNQKEKIGMIFLCSMIMKKQRLYWKRVANEIDDGGISCYG